MNKIELFTMSTPFRGDASIYGYTFGSGDKTVAIVGSMRGNEYQQLYICSLLSKALSGLEECGDIVPGREILIIPSLNYSAHNLMHKYWLSDDSDINRQFPGNPEGTATSRIAYAMMNILKEYTYGVQFPSFYMDGEFIPHIRITKTETSDSSLNIANLFGLPFIMVGEVRSHDPSTLNYNWQLAGTNAFSIYSGGTERIDEQYADLAVSSVLRFLSRMGVIKYNSLGGYISTVIYEEKMYNIKADEAGFIRLIARINSEVRRGDVIADIIDPMDGHTKTRIRAPYDGILFFATNHALAAQNEIIFKMIRKLHK